MTLAVVVWCVLQMLAIALYVLLRRNRELRKTVGEGGDENEDEGRRATVELAEVSMGFDDVVTPPSPNTTNNKQLIPAPQEQVSLI